VDLELIARERVVDIRKLGREELGASAANGNALQATGLLAALAFQFGGERVTGPDVRLAKSTTLAPGESLLVGHQLMGYKGTRDTLRVRVTGEVGGRPVETSATLPIVESASRVVYRLPLQGTWFVGAGATPHSHHRWVVAQEFAFDFVRIGSNGSTHARLGQRLSDYLAYGAPVLAAADGEVVATLGDQLETTADLRRPREDLVAYMDRVRDGQARRLTQGASGVLGNHVVIAHAGGEYSVYAHLMPRSVVVKPGDRVRAGQRIARVGMSGNTTEPHLHFHVCDSADALACAGIPVRFEGVDLPYADAPRPLQTGDIVRNVVAR